MTLHAVAVPKWGLAMEEGALTGWLVREGATIKPGDEIAEIETSKIANVLEAQAAGVLRRQIAQPGDVKPVGALLGVVSDADEPDAEIDAFVTEFEARFESEEKTGVTGPVAETIDVDGLSIRFLKIPAGREEAAAPLVLIHGFGGDYLNWMFNQEALAAERDVYALDLPGHGASTKAVGDGGLDGLADRLLGWMDRLGLSKVHLAGHSMGAAVATTLALKHPDRITSLTALCGAGFGGELNLDYIEGFITAPRRKELKPVAELLFSNADLVTREMLDDLIAYKRMDGVTEALRALSDNALSPASLAGLKASLNEITAPLLVISGEHDKVVTGPANAAPAAEVVVIAGVGHMPHLEAADKVNALMANFLSRNA